MRRVAAATAIASVGLFVALHASLASAEVPSGRDGGRGTALSTMRSAPSGPYAAQVALGRGEADQQVLMYWARTALPWAGAEYSAEKGAILFTTARSARHEVERFLAGPFSEKTPVQVKYLSDVDAIRVDFQTS